MAGIITEYNPLHRGHLRLVEVIRRELGDDTAVICCMSGDFVQRGDFAVVRRQARAKAAVMSGADLVLELPLLRAVSSAEGFAEGGVSLLLATGLVDTLVFGSERADTDALRQAAAVLLCEKFPAALRRELAAGISYPVARQRAVSELAGPAIADALSQPNDLLGVEYCKSLLRHGSDVRPMAILREGAPHDEGERKFAPIRRCAPPFLGTGEGETLRDCGKTSPLLGGESRATGEGETLRNCGKTSPLLGGESRATAEEETVSDADAFLSPPFGGRCHEVTEGGNSPFLGRCHEVTEGGNASSSAIRALLRRGEREAALARMAPAMRTCYLEEEAAGRAPVFYETVERAILYRLRSMSRDDFAALDEGREGLCNRLYDATRNTVSVRDALERAKTKRYPLSRLRRMLLWAFLGLTQADLTRPTAYLRPLAMNAVGRKLLARMRTCAALPVLTKSGDVSALGPEAVSLLQLEARAADLYALAYPDTAALVGGAVWKESPWIADAAPPPSGFADAVPLPGQDSFGKDVS